MMEYEHRPVRRIGRPDVFTTSQAWTVDEAGRPLDPTEEATLEVGTFLDNLFCCADPGPSPAESGLGWDVDSGTRSPRTMNGSTRR